MRRLQNPYNTKTRGILNDKYGVQLPEIPADRKFEPVSKCNLITRRCHVIIKCLYQIIAMVSHWMTWLSIVSIWKDNFADQVHGIHFLIFQPTNKVLKGAVVEPLAVLPAANRHDPQVRVCYLQLTGMIHRCVFVTCSQQAWSTGACLLPATNRHDPHVRVCCYIFRSSLHNLSCRHQ